MLVLFIIAISIIAAATLLNTPNHYERFHQPYNNYYNGYYNNYPGAPPPPGYGYGYGRGGLTLGFVLLVLFGGFILLIMFKNYGTPNKAGPVPKVVLGGVTIDSSEFKSSLPQSPSINNENDNILESRVQQQEKEVQKEYDYQELEDLPTSEKKTAYGEGNLYIQTGSFQQFSGANTALERLQQLTDNRARIQVEELDGITNFKVLIGPFNNREEINLYQKRYPHSKGIVKDFPNDSNLHFLK